MSKQFKLEGREVEIVHLLSTNQSITNKGIFEGFFPLGKLLFVWLNTKENSILIPAQSITQFKFDLIQIKDDDVEIT